MIKHSTLIYLVNSFQSELKSVNLVETEVDRDPEMTKKIEQSPPDRIVENILNFARSYEVMESEKVGHVEMNLN